MSAALEKYIREIRTGKAGVGFWIRSFYLDVIEPILKGKDPVYYYDETASDEFYQFVDDFCVYTMNKSFIGKKIEYLTWQKALFDCFFGIKNRLTDTRRFKEVALEVGTRNGKTEMTWPLVLYTMITNDGIDGAVAATSLAQAKILWSKCAKGIDMSPELSRLFSHKDYAPEIKIFPAVETGLHNTFKPLAKDQSKDKSKWDGNEFYFAIIDELHACDYSTYSTLKQRMGNYDDSWMWCMGTAGNLRGSLFDERREYYKKVILGTIKNDTILPILYEADVDDLDLIDESKRPEKDDPFDEATWYKANPSLDSAKSLTKMREEALNAMGDANLKNDFVIKQLNCIGVAKLSWLPAEACINRVKLTPEEWKSLDNSMVIGAYDLSKTGDITCFGTLLFDQPNQRLVFKLMCWATRAFLDSDKARRAGVPWEAWIERDLIRVSGQSAINYHDVSAYLLSQFREHGWEYVAIGYDPWSAKYLVDEISSLGWPAEGRNPVQVPVRQGMQSLSIPTQEARHLLKEKKIVFEDNPVFSWMLGNATTVTDSNGNIMLDKSDGDRSNKIDGAAVLIDALYCYCLSKNTYMPEQGGTN